MPRFNAKRKRFSRKSRFSKKFKKINRNHKKSSILSQRDGRGIPGKWFNHKIAGVSQQTMKTMKWANSSSQDGGTDLDLLPNGGVVQNASPGASSRTHGFMGGDAENSGNTSHYTFKLMPGCGLGFDEINSQYRYYRLIGGELTFKPLWDSSTIVFSPEERSTIGIGGPRMYIYQQRSYMARGQPIFKLPETVEQFNDLGVKPIPLHNGKTVKHRIRAQVMDISNDLGTPTQMIPSAAPAPWLVNTHVTLDAALQGHSAYVAGAVFGRVSVLIAGIPITPARELARATGVVTHDQTTCKIEVTGKIFCQFRGVKDLQRTHFYRSF